MSLDLRKQHVITLKKEAKIEGIKAKIALCLDRSGSMNGLYNDGTVQETINRVLPIGMAFDDDGDIDLYIFHDNCAKIGEVNVSNYSTIVKDRISKYSAGGTSYAPFIERIVKDMAPSGKLDLPVYVIVVVDGGNDDAGATKRAIIEASKRGICFLFVAIGSARFDFLDSLDTLNGTELDNVSVLKLPDLSKATDDELYRGVMKEFPSWYQQAVKKGFVKQQ